MCYIFQQPSLADQLFHCASVFVLMTPIIFLWKLRHVCFEVATIQNVLC